MSSSFSVAKYLKTANPTRKVTISTRHHSIQKVYYSEDVPKFFFLQILRKLAMSAKKEQGTANGLSSADIHLSDFTIVCKGRSFRCHKTMLAARSDVFAAMLSHPGMAEAATGTVRSRITH